MGDQSLTTTNHGALSPSTWRDRLELAELMAKSGVFLTITSAARALAAIEIGGCLGMAPAQALMNIEFGAQGKPTVSVHWQAAQLRRLGYRWEFLRHDATTCSVQFFHHQHPVDGPQTFTLQEAKAIAVYDKQQTEKPGGRGTLGDKWNWKAWTKDMLYAYVMRRFIKWHEPQILAGLALSADDEAEEYAVLGIVEPLDEEKTLQAHSADLFGDAEDIATTLAHARGTTPPQKARGATLDPAEDSDIPPASDAKERHPRASQSMSDDTHWRKILRANIQHVPPGSLRQECEYALDGPAGFSEVRGNELAQVAADYAARDEGQEVLL